MTTATDSAPPQPEPSRRSARRDEILDAALELLEEHGYARASMQKIAAAARTSKETLYAWFGDKAGLFGALVEREAEAMNAQIVAALESEGEDARDVLVRFGLDVLSLLLGPRSLAINRAAIAAAKTNPELGRILASKGRENTRPLVERLLAEEASAGRLRVADTGEAFEILMGLLVRDLQVRLLFSGAPAPDRGELERRAEAAVEAFLRLHAPDGDQRRS